MGTVRVAIIGVGNCASSLVQGVQYYRKASDHDFIPGLMHVNLGGYRPRDIRFTVAVDIDRNKVGKDLAEAIFEPPNNNRRFTGVPQLDVPVVRGEIHDGLGKHLARIIESAPGEASDIARLLRDTGTDVMVNYLPAGSERATRWYAEQALKAGCALVNCAPVFIASGWERGADGSWARHDTWSRRYAEAGLPLIGDDVKSPVGATVLQRTLINLFLDRGMPIDRTYQLNSCGNTDFLNLLEEERPQGRRHSQSDSVVSQIRARGLDIEDGNVHLGPIDYVPWQKDNKVSFLRLESRHFGGVPMSLECRLSVEDSPNSAGAVIDAIRCAKLALDRGLAGTLAGPSACFMKTPPEQHTDDEARKLTEEFIGPASGGKRGAGKRK